MSTIDAPGRVHDGLPEPIRPEHPLIAAGRFRGSAVFGNDGARLGHVHDIALDKRTGRAVYVILAAGGLLGIGRQLHAIPWRLLSYDGRRGGYVTPCSRQELEACRGLRSEELRSWAPPLPKVRDASLWPAPPRGVAPPQS